MKLTSPLAPPESRTVFAITLASPGATQSLVGPAAVPSAATASLVPASTITRLCWLLADGLSKVIVTSEPVSYTHLTLPTPPYV